MIRIKILCFTVFIFILKVLKAGDPEANALQETYVYSADGQIALSGDSGYRQIVIIIG